MFDINYDEVKKLISILEESNLSVLELQTSDGQKIHLEKSAKAEAVAAPAVQAPVQTSAQASVQTPVKDAGKAIKSPIVGVFYAAASPGNPPYAPIGKKVKKGDTVCIIEAMKCMNEIQAEEDGEIVEVLVNDGDLVEYGQPLFNIK